MKVALVNVPNFDFHENKIKMPSLSLGYLAGALCKAGHEVAVFDNPAWLVSFDNTYKRLVQWEPDVVGFTATTETRFSTLSVLRRAKKDTRAYIVAGGPHFTFTASDALTRLPEIDCIVRREGEDTVTELLSAYEKGGDFAKILGISYRDKSGAVVENADRPFITDLDSIPMPRWDLFNLSLYEGRLEGTNKKVIGVMSSRGCPHRCAFCSNSALSRQTLRLRNPGNVVDEIAFLSRTFGYTSFRFSDDTLTMNKAHVMNVCEEILKKNLRIQWSARVRIDTIDRERIALMKKAGCVSLLFGVESGSQRMLDSMHKSQTPDMIRHAIRLALDVGFPLINAGFMVSLPGELPDDLGKTIDLMKEIKGYSPCMEVTYNFTQIFPGTEFEKTAVARGILPKDFSWNVYREFPKYSIANCHVTIPYFENKDFPLEQIKAQVIKSGLYGGGFMAGVLRVIRRMKNWSQIKSVFKLGLTFLKIRKQ
jgi:anaerobic magnesium-protoporphyrin IX monomethyl ester cyclase